MSMVGRWTIGAVAVLLTACAGQPTSPAVVSVAASPAQSSVVYPAPGTAAFRNNPECLFASNTAMPAAKRSIANTECDKLLRQATNPVTKPVLPTESSSPASQSPAPACRPGQLEARFLGGGYGTGNDFGVIVLWNPGPAPCQLAGPVGFAGYDPDGSRDANAGLAHPIASQITRLPAAMHQPRDGQDLSGYLVVYLMGTERDDPAQPNGLCRRQDEGTPATLVLSIGSVTVRTANSDPGSVQVTGVYGCHGRVLLEDLQGPS
jgi:hypothetical protein